MTDAAHVPVLLEEVLAGLAIREDGFYVDGTFGRGGHSAAILRRLGPEGRLLALDRDLQAVESPESRALQADERLKVLHAPFSRLAECVALRGWTGKAAGILLDLGVSSPQLDDPARGFSFLHDGPLDMRMDATRGVGAAEWLARAKEAEIAEVLKVYGEERFAGRIARAVVEERGREPVLTTRRFAAIVDKAQPFRDRHKHPATRAFQALRIYLNRELEELEQVLQQAVEVLQPGGRLAVIAFHSLEDRIVKRFMRDAERGGSAGAMQHSVPTLRRIGKALQPGAAEQDANPRSRSAVLRVAERV
ncbi:MAG TPA: 16S rRNA (cytosine(1402)-N(4))-methyltransferase RsmH [Methylococcaceae bacterium]|nr:16S rRNA (cytosine(1402)-N(4))-methyltransferase RsmH [Methylococcaceae bacterium]